MSDRPSGGVIATNSECHLKLAATPGRDAEPARATETAGSRACSHSVDTKDVTSFASSGETVRAILRAIWHESTASCSQDFPGFLLCNPSTQRYTLRCGLKPDCGWQRRKSETFAAPPLQASCDTRPSIFAFALSDSEDVLAVTSNGHEPLGYIRSSRHARRDHRRSRAPWLYLLR